MDKLSITFQHDVPKKQFLLIVGEHQAILDYSVLDEDTLDFYHTFVPPELRGKNVGQNLVKFALQFAMENRFKVVPTCSFVEKFFEQHPEYATLMAKK